MRLGSQSPRFWHAPPAVSTAGDDAIDVAATAGLYLDEAQQFVLRHGLGERPGGRWAPREVGVCEPRQNGKGAIIEALELAWMFVTEEKLVIHSAHLADTAKEGMRRLVSLIEGVPEFDRRIAKVRFQNGDESIVLRDGRRVRFKTRTRSGGRGLTGDKVVLDEAMYLEDEVMGALMPIMSARPEGQMWYFGSAVDELVHQDGVQFARLRERGLAGDDQVAWFEWSADCDTVDRLPDGMLSDRDQWARANPAYGTRITDEAIESELRSLPARTFAVERLGVGKWPRTDGRVDQVIDPAEWATLRDKASAMQDPVWFGLDASPDRGRASIGAAGRRNDGHLHVEDIDCRDGLGWMVARCVELRDRHRPAGFVCDSRSPVATLIVDLAEAGIKVETMTTEEYGLACGSFYDRVAEKTLRHRGREALDNAIKGAAKRDLGERWAWDRRNSHIDITPLVAVTAAAWKATPRPKKRKQRAI